MFGPHSEQGQDTLRLVPALAVPRLPLSSTARTLSVTDGLPCATHVYDQVVVPVAGCQVVPPSVDSSTPATRPPPASAAVPETVIWVPSATVPGELVIAEVGAVLSVDADAAVRPAGNVTGCTPMSANRLTVAWRMF